MKKRIYKRIGFILTGVVFLLSFTLVFIKSNRLAGEIKNIEVYFVSKRGSYYGLYRSNLKTTETIHNSKEILEKFPNKARYQIAYDISHNGKYIVFHAMNKRGSMDIFLMNLESGNVKNLTDNSYTNTQPVFSNDSEWIAYLSQQKGERYKNIFIVSRDGSVKKRLTRDYYNIISLAFSPDDKEILFVKYIPLRSAISLLNIGSGFVKDLTSFSCANRAPSFNREGNKIVYSSDFFGSFDIWIMDSDGSNKRVLYESPGFEYDPGFTKDGKKVIFVSNFIVDKQKGKTGTSIFSIDLNNKTLVNLLPKKYLYNDFFCFNPHLINNDSMLYFQGKNYEDDKKTYYTIYLEDLKRARVIRLIKDRFNNTEPYILLR